MTTPVGFNTISITIGMNLTNPRIGNNGSNPNSSSIFFGVGGGNYHLPNKNYLIVTWPFNI